MAPQLGVVHAVTSIPEGSDDPPPWELPTLLDLKRRFRVAGLDLVVIESTPACIQEPIKLGLPNRNECIDRFCELITNMGRAGIPVICYNWMAAFGWLRTDLAVPRRDGALVPVAERAGVKLAVHPDDSPRSPIRGIGRLLTHPDAFA